MPLTVPASFTWPSTTSLKHHCIMGFWRWSILLRFTSFLKLHQFELTDVWRDISESKPSIHIAHLPSPSKRGKKRPDLQKLHVHTASFSFSSDSFAGHLQADLKLLVNGAKPSIILHLHWLLYSLLVIWNFPLGYNIVSMAACIQIITEIYRSLLAVKY